jgi:transcriptional regulator with XRE-family HTH domain
MNKKITENAKLRGLSERIRIVRVRHGLTQKQVAGFTAYFSLSRSRDMRTAMSCSGYFWNIYIDMRNTSRSRCSDLLEADNDRSNEMNDSPSSSEMQMIHGYRRRPEAVRKAIRMLCFNGNSFRSEEEELKELETFLAEKKTTLKNKNQKKK